MNIVVDNLLTHYVVAGEGRTVLLLHGWGDNLKGVAGLQQQLAGKYKVVSIDLPGFGATQAPPGVWGLDEYGAFLRSFLSKLTLQPYAVIGHSNGGALAIRATARGDIAPEKLILLAAAGIRDGQTVKRAVLKLVAKVGNVTTFWLPRPSRQKLRQKLYGVAGSDMLVVEHLQETFKKTVRQDVQADAAKLTLPTLLIYADQDKAVPLADGQKYQQLISGSRLEIIHDASHFLHLDAPGTVVALIEDFLQ